MNRLEMALVETQTGFPQNDLKIDPISEVTKMPPMAKSLVQYTPDFIKITAIEDNNGGKSSGIDTAEGTVRSVTIYRNSFGYPRQRSNEPVKNLFRNGTKDFNYENMANFKRENGTLGTKESKKVENKNSILVKHPLSSMFSSFKERPTTPSEFSGERPFSTLTPRKEKIKEPSLGIDGLTNENNLNTLQKVEKNQSVANLGSSQGVTNKVEQKPKGKTQKKTKVINDDDEISVSIRSELG